VTFVRPNRIGSKYKEGVRTVSEIEELQEDNVLPSSYHNHGSNHKANSLGDVEEISISCENHSTFMMRKVG
jgi:hypothetical protein